MCCDFNESPAGFLFLVSPVLAAFPSAWMLISGGTEKRVGDHMDTGLDPCSEFEKIRLCVVFDCASTKHQTLLSSLTVEHGEKFESAPRGDWSLIISWPDAHTANNIFCPVRCGHPPGSNRE